VALGAGTDPAGIVPGGFVLEQKKSLLCSNVHPLMLVYGSWINAILFFVFASSSVMAEILLPQFI
jgi:hypothetical protein